MSVITRRKLSSYMDNNLYDLIHNHFQNSESDHYIVTKINNKSQKKINDNNQKVDSTNNKSKGQKSHSASVILADKNSTQINLDRHTVNTSNSEPLKKKHIEEESNHSNDNKPHPKLKIISGDPLPKEKASIKEINTKSNEDNIVKGEDKPMEKATDKIIHKEEVVKPTQSNSSVYEMIKESAATATLIEKSQVQVKLSSNIDNFSLKKINLRSLSDNSNNFISLDHELFHLLGIVVIGKNLDIIFFFRDGTKLQIAPQNWLNADDNISKTLINNGYLYSYSEDFNIEMFAKEIHSISSYTSVNEKYTEYWIEFLPIQPND